VSTFEGAFSPSGVAVISGVSDIKKWLKITEKVYENMAVLQRKKVKKQNKKSHLL